MKKTEVKISVMSKEELEAYLSERYPKGLPKSEQEIDRESAQKRLIEKGIDKLIDRIEEKRLVENYIEKKV